METYDKTPWLRFFFSSFDASASLERMKQAGYFFVDVQHTWSSTSNVMRESGYSANLLQDESFFSLVHPEDLQTYRQLWNRVVEGWEDSFINEYRIRTAYGEYRWLRTEIFVLNRMPDGKVAQFIGRDRDIQAEKDADKLMLDRLAEAENRLLQIENLRVAGMVLSTATDLSTTVRLVLEQSSSLLKYSKNSLYLLTDEGLRLLSGLEETSADAKAVDVRSFSPFDKLIENMMPHIIDDLSLHNPPWPGDPEQRYRSFMGIPLVHRRTLLGVLAFWHRKPGVYQSEQIWPLMGFGESVALAMTNTLTLQNLQKDAQTDFLTELGTRRVLESAGPLLLRETYKNRRPLALVILDIDHFKLVNDQYGHLVGDSVLKGIGELLRSSLRSTDLVCRYGGEEFVAILPRTPATVARKVVERLRQSLETTLFPDLPSTVTGSFGLILLKAGIQADLNDLLARADTAMYEAKRMGRNRVVESVYEV